MDNILTTQSVYDDKYTILGCIKVVTEGTEQVKTEINNIKSDVEGVRADVEDTKTGIATVDARVSRLKDEVDTIQTTVSPVIPGATSYSVRTNATQAKGGDGAVALGYLTEANGTGTTALGTEAKALHNFSTAIGRNVQTGADNQTVIGMNNIVNDKPVLIVGAGSSATTPSNALEVYENKANVKGVELGILGQNNAIYFNGTDEQVAEWDSNNSYMQFEKDFTCRGVAYKGMTLYGSQITYYNDTDEVVVFVDGAWTGSYKFVYFVENLTEAEIQFFAPVARLLREPAPGIAINGRIINEAQFNRLLNAIDNINLTTEAHVGTITYKFGMTWQDWFDSGAADQYYGDIYINPSDKGVFVQGSQLFYDGYPQWADTPIINNVSYNFG